MARINKQQKRVDVYQHVTERILKFIEENDSVPWTKPWATVQSAQKNFKSDKPYNGINKILTGMSGYMSPYWLTFKQAVELGGIVKKGEESTRILFWSEYKRKETEEEKKDDGDEEKTERTYGFYKLYPIFNAEQIEGIDFPTYEPEIQQDFQPFEEAEKVIELMPNRPTLHRGGQSAFYDPRKDKVKVPESKYFKSPEEVYSVVFHELAHSTGHPDRLNRFKVNEGYKSNTAYSFEELVAEITACNILNTLKINTLTSDRNSASYVSGWARTFARDPKIIVRAASKASTAANYIMRIKE